MAKQHSIMVEIHGSVYISLRVKIAGVIRRRIGKTHKGQGWRLGSD